MQTSFMNGLQAVILPLYLGFLLYCPNADFAGVIADGAAVASAGDLGCADCACSRADYDPVAHVHEPLGRIPWLVCRFRRPEHQPT